MEKISFETFKRPNGHDEFLEWLETLPKKDSAKLLRTIEETEKKWDASSSTVEMGEKIRH